MIKSPTSKSKIFFIFSAILIVVSIVSLCVRGLNMGIDFTGGSTFGIELNETKYSAEVEARIVEIVKTNSSAKDVVVQKMGENGVSIKTTELTNEQSDKIVEALKAEYNLDQSKHISDIQKVDGNVSKRLIADSAKAVALAVILMLLYITWRFDFKSGTCAVIALTHDILIMLGFYSLFQFTVNTSFIAAVLTILGYSINATIIVFDRVRERVRLSKSSTTPNEIADDAITSSYWRAINSSITTLLTICVLYVMGVDSIKEFALPIIVGVVAGTYSSLFIASPVWAVWKNSSKKGANYASKK